jgi:hypothetical protein
MLTPVPVVFFIGTVALYTRYRQSRWSAGTNGKVSLISVVRRNGLYYYLGILGEYLLCTTYPQVRPS